MPATKAVSVLNNKPNLHFEQKLHKIREKPKKDEESFVCGKCQIEMTRHYIYKTFLEGFKFIFFFFFFYRILDLISLTSFDYNIIYSSSSSSIPHLEKQEYPCLLHYLSTIQQATTVTQWFPRLVMICQST